MSPARKGSREDRPPRSDAIADDPLPGELAFENDSESPRSREETQRRFPRERVEQAGQTGGERADEDVTADDAAPETLLDDDASRTPAARENRDAADSVLGVVPPRGIGGGTGPDEAELANVDPVGRDEAQRLRAQSDRHAHDARYLEPAGAAEARERERQHAERSGDAAGAPRRGGSR